MGVDVWKAVLVMDTIVAIFVDEREWLGMGVLFMTQAIFVFSGSSMVLAGKEEGEVQVDAGDMYILPHCGHAHGWDAT